jgi:hypothetical protein
MSLKIGNKRKLVYDWSLSVLGRCDYVVQLVLDLVFFGVVVLCSCFLWGCVLVSVSNRSGNSIRQIELPNRSGKWIRENRSGQMDLANRSGKWIRQIDQGKWIWQIDPPNRIAK